MDEGLLASLCEWTEKPIVRTIKQIILSLSSGFDIKKTGVSNSTRQEVAKQSGVKRTAMARAFQKIRNHLC